MAQDFTLNDLRRQLEQIEHTGMAGMLGLVPGAAQFLGGDPTAALARIKLIIDAMMEDERNNPDIIDAERRKRIADDAGVEEHQVADLLIQFEQLRTLMRQFTGRIR